MDRRARRARGLREVRRPVREPSKHFLDELGRPTVPRPAASRAPPRRWPPTDRRRRLPVGRRRRDPRAPPADMSASGMSRRPAPRCWVPLPCARMVRGTVGTGRGSDFDPPRDQRDRGCRSPTKSKRSSRRSRRSSPRPIPRSSSRSPRPPSTGTPARNIKWAALGFVAGLVLLVVTFATSLVAAFVGFLVMLGVPARDRAQRPQARQGRPAEPHRLARRGRREQLPRRDRARTSRTRFRRDDN